MNLITHLAAARLVLSLVAVKLHTNRLVNDALFGLKDDNGQQLKAE